MFKKASKQNNSNCIETCLHKCQRKPVTLVFWWFSHHLNWHSSRQMSKTKNNCFSFCSMYKISTSPHQIFHLQLYYSSNFGWTNRFIYKRVPLLGSSSIDSRNLSNCCCCVLFFYQLIRMRTQNIFRLRLYNDRLNVSVTMYVCRGQCGRTGCVQLAEDATLGC